MDKQNFLVIMAGGVGSRFWPLSRQKQPKQFQDILGTGQSLFQSCMDRFIDICPKENIYVVTHQDYYEHVKRQAPFLKDEQILLEPVMRNTGPCIAYACYKIFSINKKAKIIVSPADHIILKENAFQTTVKNILKELDHTHDLVTIGISPDRPDTGYGYIQYFEKEGLMKKVKTFTEKPQLELAEKFLESGDFVWNAGIFIWNVKDIIKNFRKYLPEMAENFESIQSEFNTNNEKAAIQQVYNHCKSISIDYGIMEKSDNVQVVLGDFGWSDLGTWKSLYENVNKDANGNVLDAETILYEVKNCLIKNDKGKLIVIQGLDDYIIVNNDNVLLICEKDKEQMVKNFVADAKKKNEKYI